MSPQRSLCISLVALVLFLGMPLRGGGAEEKPNHAQPGSGVIKPGGTEVTLNFQEADLRTVVTAISELTGKNFVLGPDVKGKITVISPRRVSVPEAYAIFLSALEVAGFTIVPTGPTNKIVRLEKAKSKGVSVIKEGSPVSSQEKVITEVVRLEYSDATEVSRRLKPLTGRSGLILPYEDTNSLIVVDRSSNVKRISHIIREMDVPPGRKVTVLLVKNARAEDLARNLSVLSQRLKTKKGSRPAEFKIIPYERTNALIVVASPERTRTLLNLIAELDAQEAKPNQEAFVYRLKNALVEDLATVLKETITKGASKQQGSRTPGLARNTKIFADKASNSLVVLATPMDLRALKGIIEELDSPRPMVEVEAVFMEVSTEKVLELGVQWRVAQKWSSGIGSDRDLVVLTGSSAPLKEVVEPLKTGGFPTGLFAGIVQNQISFGSAVFPSVAALVNATRADTAFNLLSQPRVLTLENQEAKVDVSTNIPFVTAAESPKTAEGAPASQMNRLVQNVEYKDVGVSLGVTPTVGDDGMIHLKLNFTVKSIVTATALEGTELAPTTKSRSIETTLLVKEGQTAVVAGLVGNDKTRSKGRTPWIGDLPVIGWLFKRTTDQDTQRSILVFLTARVLRRPAEPQTPDGSGNK